MRKSIRTLIFMAMVVSTAMAGAMIAGADHTPWTDGTNTNPDGTFGSHSTVNGNPSCDVGTHLLKIEEEDLANGTYTLSNGGEIVISNYDGTSFDWAIAAGSLGTIDANTVIVKGGPMAEVYVYPADAGGLHYADYDEGLTAPVNSNGKGDKTYGISHISFCFDPKA